MGVGNLEFLKALQPYPVQDLAPHTLLGVEGARIAGSAHTIEELNDVSEVHVVVTYNLSVGLHQGQGDEQDKVL